MKKFPALLAAIAGAALVLAPAFARASVPLLDIDISPLGNAANLGSNVYVRDHAVGLSGLNEPGMFTLSGSGNEVGGGITYDAGSMNLSFDFAYGSAFGFTDLVGDLTVLHIHGPGPVNYPAANGGGGVQFNLAPFHTPSGTRSGRITGNQVLSAGQQTQLFNNELYINIHSMAQTGGEIRGQLIVIPEPGTAVLSALAGSLLFFRRRRS